MLQKKEQRQEVKGGNASAELVKAQEAEMPGS
jgi:hypothetical protein